METGQDKEHLLQEAYADTGPLNTRLHIQEHYGTAPISWFEWVFARLALRSGMRVLDVGCGPGHVWWRNSQHLPAGVQLLLGDLSPGMLGAARDNLGGAVLSAFFFVGDGERLPFAADSVDAVVALGVFDHLPDLPQGLAEVARVLRPGGTFHVSAGGRSHLQEIEDLVSGYLDNAIYGGESEQFGLANAPAQLAGYFSAVERHDYEDTLLFREVEPIMAYVVSERRVAQALDESALADLRATIEGQLASRGELRVTRHKGVFLAHKRA